MISPLQGKTKREKVSANILQNVCFLYGTNYWNVEVQKCFSFSQTRAEVKEGLNYGLGSDSADLLGLVFFLPTQ